MWIVLVLLFRAGRIDLTVQQLLCKTVRRLMCMLLLHEATGTSQVLLMCMRAPQCPSHGNRMDTMHQPTVNCAS